MPLLHRQMCILEFSPLLSHSEPFSISAPVSWRLSHCWAGVDPSSICGSLSWRSSHYWARAEPIHRWDSYPGAFPTNRPLADPVSIHVSWRFLQYWARADPTLIRGLVPWHFPTNGPRRTLSPSVDPYNGVFPLLSHGRPFLDR